MVEASSFKDLWGAVAAVGAGIWLVTFAVIAFATTKSEILQGYLRTPSARFTVYCAIMLTNANIVSPIVTSMHWLTAFGGRPFVDGGIIVGDGLAWLLVIAALAAFLFSSAHRPGFVRRILILLSATCLELVISYRNIFGAEEWAANGAVTQLALALALPMLIVAAVAVRREFPRLARADEK